jgi:hypothetical protein
MSYAVDLLYSTGLQIQYQVALCSSAAQRTVLSTQSYLVRVLGVSTVQFHEWIQ